MRRVSIILSAAATPATVAALALGGTVADGAVGWPAVSANGSQVALFPSQLSFGSQRVGSLQRRTVTVENVGNAPLHMYGVAANDFTGSYSIPFNGCASSTLPPGQECTFSVQFQPRTVGQHTTTVYVRDDGPGSIQSVPVYGQATA
jgi:HYDIN/CFA65/VesB-like, Ig-like domain